MMGLQADGLGMMVLNGGLQQAHSQRRRQFSGRWQLPKGEWRRLSPRLM